MTVEVIKGLCGDTMKLISMLLSGLLSLTFYCISTAKQRAEAEYKAFCDVANSISAEVENEAEAGNRNDNQTETTTIRPESNKVKVTATGYCPCASCSGSYGRNTASGKTAKAKHTIAADTSIFPMNTRIELNGITYVVEDVGSAVKGYHIDIYFDSHQEALDWGKRTVEIEVVK